MSREAKIEAIHAAWDLVRRARTYDQVVEQFDEWIVSIWPMAYPLGFAPRGKGYNAQVWGTAPYVLSSDRDMSDLSLAYYDPERHRIGVATAAMYRKYAKAEDEPMTDLLRYDLLHEAQHAFDDLRSLPIPSGDFHTHYFNRRLAKLREAFPWRATRLV